MDKSDASSEQIAVLISNDTKLFGEFETFLREKQIDTKGIAIKDVLKRLNKEQRLEWSERMKKVIYG